MNNVYLYRGGFDHLISLIVELIKRRIIPDEIKEIEEYENKLLDEVIFLEIEDVECNISLLNKYLSNRIMRSIYYTFLSNDKNKEIIIYHFIRYALVYKEKVYGYRRIDYINDTIKLTKKVSQEAHKLKGFLRFKELKNHVLYGVINPTSNVIEILSYHFQKRLKEEYWIIKDENRKVYAIYDKKKVFYLKEEEIVELNIVFHEEENEMEELWKSFFKTIAIKERKNKRCQRNFMPKKYWKNIIEMEDEV